MIRKEIDLHSLLVHRNAEEPAAVIKEDSEGSQYEGLRRRRSRPRRSWTMRKDRGPVGILGNKHFIETDSASHPGAVHEARNSLSGGTFGGAVLKEVCAVILQNVRSLVKLIDRKISGAGIPRQRDHTGLLDNGEHLANWRRTVVPRDVAEVLSPDTAHTYRPLDDMVNLSLSERKLQKKLEKRDNTNQL